MIRKSIVIAAGLTLASPVLAAGNATPAATVEAAHGDRELVSFADLDLRDRKSQRALKLRVIRASERLCLRSEGKFNVDRYMGGRENSCEVRTYKQAKGQIANAISIAISGGRLPEVAAIELGTSLR